MYLLNRLQSNIHPYKGKTLKLMLALKTTTIQLLLHVVTFQELLNYGDMPVEDNEGEDVVDFERYYHSRQYNRRHVLFAV